MVDSNVAWVQCPRCRMWRDPGVELECGCDTRELSEEARQGLAAVYRLLWELGRNSRLGREAAEQDQSNG